MSYMSANNMPPVVSPIANTAPAMMPHVNVFEQKTENTYLLPYAKPHHHHVHSDAALILVLFILLVIISRGIGAFGKI
jgi:uncharacterized protein (TIGR01732 family)